MKVSKEFIIGVFIILAIALAYWGVNFLKGKDIFAEDRHFYAIYDNIEGLTVAKPVNINGYKVGQISDIYFHPDTSGRLVVRFEVNSDYPIPANSVARIYSTSILGERAIELKIGDSFDLSKIGDTLYSDIQGDLTEEVNQQVAPIKHKAEKLLGSLDTAVTLLTGFLTEQTRQDFVSTFVNLRNTFDNLEKTSLSLAKIMESSEGDIDMFLSNIGSISSNLEQNNEQLTNVIQNFSSISDSIAQADIKQTVTDLNQVLLKADDIIKKVDQGEGSLGMLINDKELYDNLADASKSLDRLLLDIKYNPNKYVQFSVFNSKERFSDEEIEEIERMRKERLNETENTDEPSK